MIPVISPASDIRLPYSFKPESAYRNKLFLYIITMALGIWITLGILIGFISFIISPITGSEAFQNRLQLFLDMFGDEILIGFMLINLILIGSSIILVIYSVGAIEYTLDATDVVVRRGILKKTVTHIPFRTITNVSTRYGIYDRFFGIGTVEIETASAKSGAYVEPEAKVEGIRNFREIRDFILTSLRTLSGVYTTTTESVMVSGAGNIEFYQHLYSILKEIKDILS